MIRKTIAFEESLIDDLELFAKKDDRDFSSATRYALRIGLLALENPELTVKEIRYIIAARVEHEAGKVAELKIKDLG
ncbi:MAG: hypothetical protein GQ544_02020 [Candidatus Aminicenantes bacterium]|nr:hypothetical protein [Candidatus Aminicenantes bacterium]